MTKAYIIMSIGYLLYTVGHFITCLNLLITTVLSKSYFLTKIPNTIPLGTRAVIPSRRIMAVFWVNSWLGWKSYFIPSRWWLFTASNGLYSCCSFWTNTGLGHPLQSSISYCKTNLPLSCHHILFFLPNLWKYKYWLQLHSFSE